MQAIISDIKRMAVHDGQGIRTTVFFKGCPLKCVWCHNPESIGSAPQLYYNAEKCINCGECVTPCNTGAHAIKNGAHAYLRDNCAACGACVNSCLGSALTLYGKKVTVEELLPTLLEDKLFYDTSGGGVTLSGGECLLQPQFCKELLKALKKEGIHTAVDTCGFVNRESIDAVLPFTDVFLYDIKAIDEQTHIKCTGHSNKNILENLKYINGKGKSIEIRIPYVPQYNDGEIEKIAEFLKEFKNIKKVEVLAYHNFAGSKYTALGMQNTLPQKLPTKEEVEAAQAKF